MVLLFKKIHNFSPIISTSRSLDEPIFQQSQSKLNNFQYSSLVHLDSVKFSGRETFKGSKALSQGLQKKGIEKNITIYHQTPTILAIPQVFSSEQCQQIIQLAKTVIKSESLPLGLDKGSEWRSVQSKSSQLTRVRLRGQAINDLVYPAIKQLKLPIENMETFVQIVRYQAGEQMTFHTDSLKPKQNKTKIRTIQNQRTLSLVIPLSSQHQGGETEFKDQQINQGRSLKIKLPSGSALLFEPDLNHRGAPINSGEKWVLVIWFREKAV